MGTCLQQILKSRSAARFTEGKIMPDTKSPAMRGFLMTEQYTYPSVASEDISVFSSFEMGQLASASFTAS